MNQSKIFDSLMDMGSSDKCEELAECLFEISHFLSMMMEEDMLSRLEKALDIEPEGDSK